MADRSHSGGGCHIELGMLAPFARGLFALTAVGR